MHSSRASLSRRNFLIRSSLLTGTLAAFPDRRAAAEKVDGGSRLPVIAFSKPFQTLTAVQTAELVATVGWDGIEIPVRAKGQIEPERAPEELPLFSEAMKREQKEILLVATDITSLKTPHAEKVMRTMAKLGIRRLRLGFFPYPKDRSPTERLGEIEPALRDIAAACQELGLQAGFQNHSGMFVGAPVWDVFSMIRSLNPKHIGFCFDIGHATVEGGLSWPIEARLVESFYTAVLVKDFFWKKESDGWKDSWCPLGEGMVNRSFFDRLKRTSFDGPICQHHEYPLGDRLEMIRHFQQDLKVLREWLG